MGYIPGGGLFHSALGDMLAAASNKYSGFAPAAPGAVRIENACTAVAGRASSAIPPDAAGTLTSGGSIANLTAVVTAREARDPEGGGAVYLTRFAHHCVDKALHIAGRGRAPRRVIATDDRYRMSVDALEQALEEDRRNGIRPWLVVASAGTVDTGAIDPLPEIAELCRRYGAWLHVDGAYGGLFTLCDEGREKLRGIEQADSVALDPHKTLFLPYGTGAVRGPRRPAVARRVQRQRRLYPAVRRNRRRPVARRSLARADAPLSRDAPVAAVADRRRRRVPRGPGGKARARPLFPCAPVGDRWLGPGPEPELSVVAFRYLPKTGDVDEFNERLMRHIQQEGRVMLSGTRIDGSYRLRCAILCFRTHIEHVDECIDAVVRGVAALDG